MKLGGETHAFTTAAVPVMTRLRMRERAVLDTLVDAGVARSRSEALAWCVRLVGDNESAWIEKLRGALGAVQRGARRGSEARPPELDRRSAHASARVRQSPGRHRRPISPWRSASAQGIAGAGP